MQTGRQFRAAKPRWNIQKSDWNQGLPASLAPIGQFGLGAFTIIVGGSDWDSSMVFDPSVPKYTYTGIIDQGLLLFNYTVVAEYIGVQESFLWKVTLTIWRGPDSVVNSWTLPLQNDFPTRQQWFFNTLPITAYATGDCSIGGRLWLKPRSYHEE